MQIIKPLYIFATILLSINKVKAITSTTDSSKSKTTWINEFKGLRTALYKNNRQKLKSYFSFPIIDKSNQIWIPVTPEDEVDGIYESKKTIPFTERDFDKYYNKLFSKRFINGLLKIKTDLLYKTGETASPEFKEGDSLSYTVYVYYEKKQNILSLNFALNRVFKDKAGEIMDGGESSIIYTFTITKEGRLKFQEIVLAG